MSGVHVIVTKDEETASVQVTLLLDPSFYKIKGFTGLDKLNAYTQYFNEVSELHSVVLDATETKIKAVCYSTEDYVAIEKIKDTVRNEFKFEGKDYFWHNSQHTVTLFLLSEEGKDTLLVDIVI